MFTALKKVNTDFPLFNVKDDEFKKYGQIIDDIDSDSLLKVLADKTIPDVGNTYVASDVSLESLPITTTIKTNIFGGLPIEVGYCNGHSHQLNCLEWHNSPEVNIATEDIVLFLGQTPKLQNDHYDVSDIEVFFIPAGTMIAIYGTTMHFAPCRTSDRGFKCLVVLLKDINADLPENLAKPKTLFKYGKWLITHPDNEKFTSQGAFPGIIGQNYELKLM